MCTENNPKISCITFVVALMASLSVLALGVLAQKEELKNINPPLEAFFDWSEKNEGFIVSDSGFILSNSSPNYHKPQVTAIDNPYTNTQELVKKTMTVELTGYSSTVDQTNSDPFTTASGARVRDGIVASNSLPFGTKIRIPEYFGDKIFVVKDRMNRRYSYPKNDYYDGYVDIWFSTRQQAINFGRVRSTIEVLY